MFKTMYPLNTREFTRFVGGKNQLRLYQRSVKYCKRTKNKSQKIEKVQYNEIIIK